VLTWFTVSLGKTSLWRAWRTTKCASGTAIESGRPYSKSRNRALLVIGLASGWIIPGWRPC
jgi:hypothetical protein